MSTMLWGWIMNFRKLHRHGHVAYLITHVHILSKSKEDSFNTLEKYYRVCNRRLWDETKFQAWTKNIYIFMTGIWDACLFDYVATTLFFLYHEHRNLLEFDFSIATLRNIKIHWSAHFFKICFVMIAAILFFCADFLQCLSWVDQRPVPKWRIFLITPGPFHQPL